jgi:hypothetical protein
MDIDLDVQSHMGDIEIVDCSDYRSSASWWSNDRGEALARCQVWERRVHGGVK